MTIGTKSLLFGAHQFILHPILVALGWWILYGFPFDPRLWIAFVIHDWGYWGKPNMDGTEGKCHPLWAGDKMTKWFGNRWGTFCAFHSRSLAKEFGSMPSKLCAADKMVTSLTPAWLYLPMARATGELEEYMDQTGDSFVADSNSMTPQQWFGFVGERTRAWAENFSERQAV